MKKKLNVVIDELVIEENFEKSRTEIETCEPMEELYDPQINYSDQPIVPILVGLSERKPNGPRIEATLKRYAQNNTTSFEICQDYYKLPKKTIRLSEPMVLSVIYLNQTNSQMFPFSIKTNQVWI